MHDAAERRDDGESAAGAPAAAPPDDRWERHPADVARLAGAIVVLLLGMGLNAWRPQTVQNASADLARLLDLLPELLQTVLAGGLQLAAVAAPVGVAVVLVAGRRWRLLLTVAVTAAVAAGISSALQSWLDDVVPRTVVDASEHEGWLTGQAFPSGTYLGATAAVATLLLPCVPRRWRRWLVGFVVAAALCRIVTAVVVPVNVVVLTALGAALGSIVLVAFGAPTRRASLGEAAAGAARAGVPVSDLVATPGRAATHHFEAVTRVERRPVTVTLVGRDDRDAELLARSVRALTTKAVDDRPLRLRGETRLKQEALCTLAARRLVPAPDVLGVGETPDGDAVLVLAAVDGPSLTDFDVDDDALREVWTHAARLREHRLAHGALALAAFRATPEGVVLTGFGAGELGADTATLDADLAELLVTTAAAVGPGRAVASAVASSLPPDALKGALTLVQPQALSRETRRGVDDVKRICAETRTALQDALGVDEVELIDLARITPAKVMSAAGTVFLALMVFAFVGNIDTVGEALGRVDWAVLPFLLLMVVVGTFAGGWGLVSAVTRPLPFLRTSEVMLAQSFLNRFTPANAGGMALRARYLQKNGVELTQAATSVGLTSAASGAVQAVLLVAVSIWAGAQETTSFSLPDASQLAVIVVVLVVLGGLVYVVPAGRRLVFGRLADVVGDAWRDLRTLATQPSKVIGLFGSAALSKTTTLAAFVASCAASDISLATSQLVFLYMTANTVASAAPTPGGVGAIEAALIAALTGAGVDPSVAVSAVVVFRLATYWLPVPPSYVALRHLRSVDAV